MSGYERIKQLAKSHRCNIPDLLVLARQNDPFFAGGDASRAKAEWFVDLWRRFGYSTGIHLRRVHYQVASPGNIRKHDGTQYENTDNDWNYLLDAGKYARYLGLVDPEAFVDRRNPEPHVFASCNGMGNIPDWSYAFYDWELPRISTNLTMNLGWELPRLEISGYRYSEDLQPFHMEVWVEKSTMDDVLVPICRRFEVNLATGLGFMSITSVIGMLKRAKGAGKPCRIFYISDFDPAGDGMPTAVARQIEFWLDSYAYDMDIKLNPLVLTREQVERYRLPRIPVKETDRRKANFEERYGEGAVELDALEALHPGELAKIISEHILQFRDARLERKLRQAREEAEEKLNAIWGKRIHPYQKQVDTLEERIREVAEKYRERLEGLSEELSHELEAYHGLLETLRQGVQDELDSIDVCLPDPPTPEVSMDETDWLFDSSRDYFEQLAVYKARKNGGME